MKTTPDGTLQIFDRGEVVDSSTGKLVRKLELPPGMLIRAAASAPDEWVVLWVEPVPEGTPKLLAGELRSGSLKSIHLPYGASSLSMDAKGSRVAVAVRNNVLVFDARTLRAVGIPLGHPFKLGTIAFSQDGAELAVGGFGSSIWLWDMHEQQRFREALSVPFHVDELLFSPDRSKLLSVGDEKALLWDLNPESYRRRALEQANRPMTQAEKEHYLGLGREPATGGP